MFGSDLAKQLAERTTGSPFGGPMQEVAEQIEADRETLAGLMDALGTTRNPVKQATTWMAEKVSRVKLSGLSVGEEELGLLLALETLSLGVEGKISLWEALRAVRDTCPPLQQVDLDALLDRAKKQRATLEEERVASARRAITRDS
jgi:hypothetical protein